MSLVVPGMVTGVGGISGTSGSNRVSRLGKQRAGEVEKGIGNKCRLIGTDRLDWQRAS